MKHLRGKIPFAEVLDERKLKRESWKRTAYRQYVRPATCREFDFLAPKEVFAEFPIGTSAKGVISKNNFNVSAAFRG